MYGICVACIAQNTTKLCSNTDIPTVYKYRDPSPTPTLDTEGDFGERTHRGHHSVHFTYYTVTVYSVQYTLCTLHSKHCTPTESCIAYMISVEAELRPNPDGDMSGQMVHVRRLEAAAAGNLSNKLHYPLGVAGKILG